MEIPELDKLPTAHLIEAAVVVLGRVAKVADPNEAVERLREVLPGPGHAEEVIALLHEASEDSADELADLLRMVLASSVDARLASQEETTRALQAAGSKQLVVTPDLLYLAGFLAVYCIASLRNKASEEVHIQVEETPDGKKKTTINKKVKYFNPFSTIPKLVEKIGKYIALPRD